jgi:hypothetical protein
MNAIARRVPWWYWAVAILATLWMLSGVANWILDWRMGAEQLAQLSDGQRQLYASRPYWVFVVFGIAVFSGLAGAIGLLLRKRWATTWFLVSLVALVVQLGYTIVGMHAIQVLGAGHVLPFSIVLLGFGVFLLWFARYARRHGWIPGDGPRDAAAA